MLVNTKKQKLDMTSRERMLAAILRKEVDYVPCSPWFNSLRPEQRVGYKYQFPWGPSQQERIEYCISELNVDPVIDFGINSSYPDPQVSNKAWLEGNVIHKVWDTPSGTLHASVKYNEKWPFGIDIPFYSDFNVGHFIEPWIKSFSDLECLKHILVAAHTKEQIEKLRSSYIASKKLADKYNLAVYTNIGMGLTGAMQLIGSTQLCMMTVDQPDLVDSYLQLEHEVNLRHMEIAADLGVDIIHRNGFYESADFYSPDMLELFIGSRLRSEIELVHQAGKTIVYTINTGVMPLLDYLDNLEFDCLMNIDIAFKGFNLLKVKEKLGDKRSFWIGPSSTYHLWDENPEVTRKAVRDVFEIMGKKGLIITPCPSAHSIMPWENVLAMIDEWKKHAMF